MEVCVCHQVKFEIYFKLLILGEQGQVNPAYEEDENDVTFGPQFPRGRSVSRLEFDAPPEIHDPVNGQHNLEVPEGINFCRIRFRPN